MRCVVSQIEHEWLLGGGRTVDHLDCRISQLIGNIAFSLDVFAVLKQGWRIVIGCASWVEAVEVSETTILWLTRLITIGDEVVVVVAGLLILRYWDIGDTRQVPLTNASGIVAEVLEQLRQEDLISWDAVLRVSVAIDAIARWRACGHNRSA